MKFFADEENRDITGYEAVRAAARDYATYSSDLQGDRDVRDYRQIPLEMDPPQHTDYRHAIQPLFLRPKLESHSDAFYSVARFLLDSARDKSGPIDVYFDLSLPYVVNCLGIIYDRPQDVEEWISWGPDVWTARGPTRSGETLHSYLKRVFSESEDATDIWGVLRGLRIKGSELSEQEFKGYASVLLAGGRDTVIKLITGLVWHLINNPDHLYRIQGDPELEKVLINEMLRFLSPLPAIERVAKAGGDSPSSGYHRLHFASANHDPGVWESPEEISLDRGKQPHLAFGYGPHACIGMNMAEYEARAWLKAFLPMAKDFELLGGELKFSEVNGIRFVSDLRDVFLKTV